MRVSIFVLLIDGRCTAETFLRVSQPERCHSGEYQLLRECVAAACSEASVQFLEDQWPPAGSRPSSATRTNGNSQGCRRLTIRRKRSAGDQDAWIRWQICLISRGDGTWLTSCFLVVISNSPSTSDEPGSHTTRSACRAPTLRAQRILAIKQLWSWRVRTRPAAVTILSGYGPSANLELRIQSFDLGGDWLVIVLGAQHAARRPESRPATV
jgi:hypothetical protein